MLHGYRFITDLIRLPTCTEKRKSSQFVVFSVTIAFGKPEMRLWTSNSSSCGNFPANILSESERVLPLSKSFTIPF